jgi:hypothetical protein
MKNWAKQVGGAVLVLVFALALGAFVMVLRTQQGGLAATIAAAHIRAVSPPDGATNVPLDGEIRADYVSQPKQDPVIKLEPPVGVTLDNAHWDGTTFVVDYSGLRDNSLYHVELDQDDSTQKGGEHKQIKVRWSFHTGSVVPTGTAPQPTITASASPLNPNQSYAEVTYGGPYQSGLFTYVGVTYYVATASRDTYNALLMQNGKRGWEVAPVPGIPSGWNLTCARDAVTTAWTTEAPGYQQAAHAYCDGSFVPGS